jgi:hypothetical protein
MKDVSRRLDKIEKQLNVGKETEVLHVVSHLTFQDGTAPDIPEPYEDWTTYKTALQEAVEKGKVTGLEILAFDVDPFREYEVRNNLPEGILSQHELAGKIPFDELLGKATGDNEKQPNTEK